MCSKLVAALYSNIEGYPPSINAIQLLAEQYDEIVVLNSNVFKNEFVFKKNVVIKSVGKFIDIRSFENKSILLKIIHFIKYVYFLKVNLKNANVFIAYDAIPLLAFKIIRLFEPFKRAPMLWYHNHDVYEPGLNRKFSIAWFAEKNEPKMFPAIDIFSLPAEERKKFFPIHLLHGAYFFLPNYPSIEFYNKFINQNKIFDKEIKLIYQGSIGPGHGLEAIISILPNEILGRKLTLHLKGFISDAYKLELKQIAKLYFAETHLFFYPVTAYQDVPKLASTCHIGIGIHTGTDRMNSSLGTSSNKIYEYAALGLPVLLYKNKHFVNALSMHPWATFTDLSALDLINCIKSIADNYEFLSKSAIDSFYEKLNYEHYFKEINL